MKQILFTLTIVALTLASCGQPAGDYKKLEAERDSLIAVNAKAQTDLDEMLSIMNEVEDGFRQIKEAENYLVTQSNSTGEVTTTTREKLKNDLSLVTETLKKNKEQLSKLQRQLKDKKIKSAEMQKVIERLTNEIEEKSAMIANLQEELSKRDIRIKELDDAVASLNTQVGSLSEQTEQQQNTIKTQDTELNTVYYAIGSKSELKKEKVIVSGDVLKGDFNPNFFATADMRTLKEIPLMCKRAKILTQHPASSYTLKKDDKKMLTLVINDPQKFWSTSKYLVIQN